MQECRMIELSCILALQIMDSFKLYIIFRNQGLLLLAAKQNGTVNKNFASCNTDLEKLKNTLLGCSLVHCLQLHASCILYSVLGGVLVQGGRAITDLTFTEWT